MDKDSATLLQRIYNGHQFSQTVGILFSAYYKNYFGAGEVSWLFVKALAKELFDQGYFDTQSGEFECFDDVQAFNYILNFQGYRQFKKNLEENLISEYTWGELW
jgi:hypothetical protein